METAESFKQSAIEITGLSDFGEAHFEPLVEAYVKDLANPDLSDLGRHVFTRLLIADLVRRLQAIECFKTSPEIDDVVIPPIFYISGLERTGTTFLHNLLSLDRNSRHLKRWELMHPTPPPEASTYLTDPRIAKTKASIDKLRGSLLEQLHWVEAEDPEECAWGMIDGYGIMGVSAVTALPTFLKATLTLDPKPRFREYRRLMQLLLWKNPPPNGGHLVLKSPQVLFDMPDFLSVFPEAHLILMHRDPFRATTSLMALQSHIHGPFFQQKTNLKDRLVDFFPSHAERRMSLMNKVFAATEGVTHVAYPNLVQDPIETVESIYQDVDQSLPSDMRARLEAFINEQRAGKRAKPAKELPSFGLDQDEFLSRPAVAEYCMAFGVEVERERQTGM
ncbi:MAG: sulfotransferase [Pseudomonadota bacterium]